MRDGEGKARTVGDRLALLLATGFGLGRSPFAPGTVGALLGVPLSAALLPLLNLPYGWVLQSIAGALLCAVAVPVCDRAERLLETKDPHCIVADEYLTFPLCLIGIHWMGEPWILPAAFVLSRISDIIKPPPARQLENLGGGLGIVMDDVLASLYTLAVNHAMVYAMAARHAAQGG